MASTPGTVLFPAAPDDGDSLIRAANNATSTLAAPLAAGDGTLTLADASRFPTASSLSLPAEIVYYTGKVGNTLTGLVRSCEGTTAAALLPAGTVIELRATARHHTVLADAIIATQGKLGSGASAPATATFLKGTGPGTSAWSALASGEVTAALGYTPITPTGATAGGLLVGTGADTAAWQATSALVFTGGQLGINRAAPGAMLHAVASGAAVIGGIVQGAASQTANLTEWRDSAGTVLASVGSGGRINARTDVNTGIALSAASPWATLNVSLDVATGIGISHGGNQIIYALPSFTKLSQAVGIGTGSSLAINARLSVLGVTAGAPVAVIQGVASQSANLTQWQNSSGTLLSYVGPTGMFIAKAGSDTTLAGGEGSFGVDGSNNVVVRSNASIILSTASWLQLAGGTAFRFQGGNGTIDAYNGAATTLTLTNSSGSGRITEIVKAGSGQSTTNLTEWQNSSGTILASVNAAGQITVGTTATIITANQIYGNNASNFHLNYSGTGQTLLGNATGLTYGLGAWAIGSGTNLAQLSVFPTVTSTKGIVVRGFASQTASLQEWQDSAGTILARVSAAGAFLSNDAAGAASFTIDSASRLFEGYGIAATVGAPAQNSPVIRFYSNYWNGSTAVGERYQIANRRVSGSGVAGDYILAFWDHTNVFSLALSGNSTGAVGVNLGGGSPDAYGAQFVTAVGSAARKGVVVRGAASQSANLTEWQDSAGARMSSIDAAGRFGIVGDPSTSYSLNVATPASATQLGILGIAGTMGAASGFQYGIFVDPQQVTTTTGSLVGIATRVKTSNAVGTLPNAVAFRALAPGLGAGSVITQTFGVHIENQGLAGSSISYGLFIAAQSGATASYALYSAGGQSRLDAGAAANMPLALRGAASQTANLQEWQNSSGTMLSATNASGGMWFRTNSFVTAPNSSYGSIGLGASNVLTLQSTVTIGLYTPLVDMSAATTLRFFNGSGTIDAFVNTITSTLTLTNSGAGQYKAIIKAASVQGTTNITEWQNSAGTVMAYVDPLGGYTASPNVWTDLSGQRRGVQANASINAPADSSASYRAVMGSLNTFGGAFNYTGALTGGYFLATHGSAGTIPFVTGVLGSAATGAGHGVVTAAMYGGNFGVTHSGSANVVAAAAIQASLSLLNAAATVTTGYGVVVASPTITAGATIGTNHGISVLNQGVAGIGINYGIFIANQIGATTNYALYSAGGAVAIDAGAAAVVPLRLRAAASQSADLQQWQNSSGTVLTSVVADGRLGVVTAPLAGWNLTVNVDSNNGVLAQGNSTKTSGSSYGMYADPNQSISTSGSLYGLVARTRASAAVTVVAAYGIQVDAPSYGAGASITTNTGIRVQNQGSAAVGTSYGMYIANQTGAISTTYSIFSAGGTVAFQTGAAATKGLLVQGAASQSANLQEWLNSSGTVLAAVAADGRLGILTAPTPSFSAYFGWATGLLGALAIDASITTTSGTIYGAYLSPVQTAASSGVLATLSSGVRVSATGALGTGYGLSIAAVAVTAGGTIANQHGINIANQGATGITTSYGLRIADQSGATTSYAIYSSGGASRLLAGTDVTPLSIFASGAQTANLLDIRAFSGVILASFNASGALFASQPASAGWQTVGTFQGGGNLDASGTLIEFGPSTGSAGSGRLYAGRWLTGNRGMRLVARTSGNVEKSYLHLNAEGDSFQLASSGGVKVEGNATGIGFFAATPVAKPAVTGSRGGNAAVAALLTALASLGLITDSTTA